MSLIFYDHLIILDGLDRKIASHGSSDEERHELWHLIDEILHQKVLLAILGKLPHEHHTEFLERFHAAPHHHGHLKYLAERIKEDVEELIVNEAKQLANEIESILTENTEE